MEAKIDMDKNVKNFKPTISIVLSYVWKCWVVLYMAPVSNKKGNKNTSMTFDGLDVEWNMAKH